MLKKILIALALTILVLWFVWWWSWGFPSQMKVCDAPPGGTEHCDNYDFFVGSIWKVVTILDRYAVLLTAFATAAIAIFTYILYKATGALVKADEDKTARIRAMVGAGGQIVHRKAVLPDLTVEDSIGFQIEATNAGDGAAIIELIRWGYGELGELPPVPGYGRQVTSGQHIFPRSGAPVRHIPLPPEDLIRPLLFFEFDYTDVSRGGRGRVGFVMEVYNPDFRALPVHTKEGVSSDYLKDIYPL